MDENNGRSSKMIGLFTFDGPMYCDCNGVYCNTTITAEMFERYFQVVDKVIVAIRTFHLDKSYEEAHLHKVELDGLEIFEISNLNSAKGMLLDKKKYKSRLFELILNADMIFARMPSVISNMVIHLAIKQDKPYMVEVGGCAWDSYWNHGIVGKIVAPYMFYEERYCVKHAKFASYVTEKWLQNRYPCACPSIAASNVYLPPFDDEVLQKRLKKIESKNADDPIIIGTTAAVNVRYKGQEYIIRAIAKLNKRGYNFEYELVGDGDPSFLRQLSERLGIADKVRFKGVMLHADVLEWLDYIDIYAQPSKQEGLPRALIEAMSRGCPAIGSTTAGIPELLNDECIFPNGDIKRVCEILELLTSIDLFALTKRNCEKTKEFVLTEIEERRREIYKKYAELNIEKQYIQK